jgi:hypothetical protein
VPDSRLIARVRTEIQRATHNRIRDLSIEEDRGRIVVRGRAPTHHAKQLAQHGALTVLPAEGLRTEIGVG